MGLDPRLQRNPRLGAFFEMGLRQGWSAAGRQGSVEDLGFVLAGKAFAFGGRWGSSSYSTGRPR